jgi:hypothetical protein
MAISLAVASECCKVFVSVSPAGQQSSRFKPEVNGELEVSRIEMIYRRAEAHARSDVGGVPIEPQCKRRAVEALAQFAETIATEVVTKTNRAGTVPARECWI